MTIEERDATRERVDANRFWNNGFVWDDVSVKSLRFEWLIPGGKQSCSRMNPCVHPSLHGALRRDYLFEHMVPRIRQDAMNKVRGSHAVLGRWALVGSCAFWAEMARVFAEQTVDAQELQALWAGVFDTAARHGNTTPFDYAPHSAIETFAAALEQPRTEGARPIHPKIGLWLAQKKYVALTNLQNQVNADAFPLQYCFFLNRGVLDDPVSPEYVANTCLLFLRDYDLSQEQKIRVAGQAMIAFGVESWEKHLAPLCEAHLQGIDLGLLKALCMGMVTKMDIEDALGLALTWASQDPEQGFNETRAAESLQEVPHAHLSMLVDLAPPQTRLELYYLAVTAKQMDSAALEPPPALDRLELPNLD